MGFIKGIQSSILISWVGLTFLFIAIYTRQLLMSFPEGIQVGRIIFLWTTGLVLVVVIRYIISVSGKKRSKWVFSIFFNLLLVLIVSLGLQLIGGRMLKPVPDKESYNQKRVVNDKGYVKEIEMSVQKKNPNITYDFFWMYLIVIGIVYSTTAILELNSEKQKQLELQEKLSKAKLNTLRAQLNPHFMFNALNTVSGLMEDNTKEAQQVLEDFSFLLRDVIDKSNEHFISVEDEIFFIQRYVNIEKKRFGPKLKIGFLISQESRAGKIPSMILQPIVENAIKHGVLNSNHNQKRKNQPGSIIVNSIVENKRLLISVSDNGQGFPGGKLIKGSGLRITEERLENLYKNDGHLIIKDIVTGGLQVTLDIPFEFIKD